MTDTLSSQRALRLATIIQRASREPALWPLALSEAQQFITCPSVFGYEPLPVDIQNKEALKKLAVHARNCAESCSGCCGIEPSVATAENKRQTCLTLLDYLDLALSSTNDVLVARAWSAAEHVLDAVKKPLLACGPDLQLIHANRAGHDELRTARFLNLVEGRVELIPGNMTERLQRELQQLRHAKPDTQTHLRFVPQGGCRADLHLRVLNRRDDFPGLFLLHLDVLSDAVPAQTKQPGVAPCGCGRTHFQAAGACTSVAVQLQRRRSSTSNGHLTQHCQRAYEQNFSFEWYDPSV
jgi:hypothetical protein